MGRVIHLHKVKATQGITSSGLKRLAKQRLNFFPGRALGEQEFDRIQARTDKNIKRLNLASTFFGIQHGLVASRIKTEQDNKQKNILQVSAGSGTTREGNELTLNTGIEQDWEKLRDNYKRQHEVDTLHGLYLLTIKHIVLLDDDAGNPESCRRQELDRLRDARLEMAAMLGLFAIPENHWQGEDLDGEASLITNRFLGHLNQQADDPLQTCEGVSVALLLVKNDELSWLNVSGGAFPANSFPYQRALLKQTEMSLQQAYRQDVNTNPFSQIHFLPAACQLPANVLSTPASVNPLPEVKHIPKTLDVDLLVLPQSRVPKLLEENLAREPLDLQTEQKQKIRLGVVVHDNDYRTDLLALPTSDSELLQAYYRSEREANEAYASATQKWLDVYGGLTVPDQAYLEEFGLEIEKDRPDRPQSSRESLQEMLASKDWACQDAEAGLHAPYQETFPVSELPPIDDDPLLDKTGLVSDWIAVNKTVEDTEEMLQDLVQLMDAVSDAMKLQRQHFDSLTVDFSRLAGGVAGDGAGLQISRFLDSREMKKSTE